MASKQKLWALDVADGHTVWSQTLADSVSTFAAPAMMVDDNPGVVVTTFHGHVYRLSAATGDVIWHRIVDDEEFNQGAAVGVSRTVYVAGAHGALHALNPDDGTDRWPPFVTGAANLMGPAVDFRANRDWIYFVDSNKTVWALDDSGVKIWNQTLSDSAQTPLVIAPGEILYTSIGSVGNATVIAINRRGQIWSVPMPAPARYLAVGYNGDVYATSLFSTLSAIQ